MAMDMTSHSYPISEINFAFNIHTDVSKTLNGATGAAFVHSN